VLISRLKAFQLSLLIHLHSIKMAAYCSPLKVGNKSCCKRISNHFFKTNAHSHSCRLRHANTHSDNRLGCERKTSFPTHTHTHIRTLGFLWAIPLAYFHLTLVTIQNVYCAHNGQQQRQRQQQTKQKQVT